jgi:hypothetical protein
MVGHPKEGAQIGATAGGVVAPFAPDAWFSRAPYGLNRIILGEEGLADARAASKVAQNKADIAAGLKAALPATPPGAPLPDSAEFYEQRATDLMRRGREQAALDRTAARNAPKPAPPGPVGTSTAPESVANLPQSALPGIAKGVTSSTGPEASLNIGTPKAAAAVKQGLGDISPRASEPRFSGSEGRPATWTNETVTKLAGQGNRDAISQAIRRGLGLPENARYVAGDADYPRAVLNPRETTRFSPDGTPIRNTDNPLAQTPSSKARIEPGEMPAARVETPAPAAPQAKLKSPEGILPGMNDAVVQQRIAAGVEQGRQLTEKLNATPRSIEAAAGEMETKSPLFRGTDASPQNEMFSGASGKPRAPSPENLQTAMRAARGTPAGTPEVHRQVADKLAEVEELHTAGQPVAPDDLEHLKELADEFEGKPQSQETDIKAQIAKARSRANQYNEKMANARNWQTANRYMRQMQALEQKATKLEQALKEGKTVAPELKGATRAELNATYNAAHPDVKATADYLADAYGRSESQSKTDFEQHYGLKSGTTKGLPIKEKIARFLVNHPEEVADYVKEIRRPSEE